MIKITVGFRDNLRDLDFIAVDKGFLIENMEYENCLYEFVGCHNIRHWKKQCMKVIERS
tara:strand:+ start:76 stop:252 length:177 start_codon:yes stop_codon:yes gene_type:complete